ncbi:MAG: hypothetical protein JNL61_02670, partial [Rhizobiaceae bacterium]|nr:hypothetical protein [Rhizobiaceae bacterium]
VIHDPATRRLLGRRWTTKAWIICDCGFEDRKRDVMGSNAPGGGAGWTNLFFLDEVTALAAGHRPCYFCRRDKAKEFADCLAKGLGIAMPSAPSIDRRLHAERLASRKNPSPAAMAPVDAATLEALPDGAMLQHGGHSFAKRLGQFRAWNFSGWTCAVTRPATFGAARLITPASTVAALLAGYRPVWHPSIDGPE